MPPQVHTRQTQTSSSSSTTSNAPSNTSGAALNRLQGSSNATAARPSRTDGSTLSSETREGQASVSWLSALQQSLNPQQAPTLSLGRGETLQGGQKGDKVRSLQEMLNRSGAGLKLDGDFGPATRKAVRDFQRQHGLSPDGIVGPKTMAALNAPPQSQSAQTGEVAQTGQPQASGQGQKLADYAKTWDKKSFKPGQTKRCADFVSTMLKNSGTAPEGFKHTARAADFAKYGDKVGQKDLQPGDVVLFGNTYRKGKYTHVGVYLGDNKFVHRPTANKPVRIDSMGPGSYYGKKFTEGRRLHSNDGAPQSSQIQSPQTSRSTGNRRFSGARQALDNLPGALRRYADTFVKAGEKYGVDPRFLAAISQHETGNGTSSAFRNKRNAMGISGRGGPRRMSSVEASIEQMARTLAKPNGYYRGKTTIGQVGKVYAPVGASNDPHGLNGYWAKGVAKYFRALGGDPTQQVIFR